MNGYADPELIVAAWLNNATGIKIWTDPRLPGNMRHTAALAHLQRAAGNDDLPLSLDEPLFDVDVYAANADHARTAAHQIWQAMVWQLPHTTFGNGVFVKRVQANPPRWAPDPQLYRRTASYRVLLHGVVDTSTPADGQPFADGGSVLVADLDHPGLTDSGSVLTVDLGLTGATSSGSILTVTV